MWQRYLRRAPPGDPILYQLVAQIGYIVEAANSSKPVDSERWFWWLPDEGEDIEKEPDKQDEAHRAAVLRIARGS